jgi:nitrogen regulatory protein P-II 1
MKEIKAFIRRCCVNAVVEALERAGAPGITIVEVHPVGYGYEPNYFEPQFQDAYKRYSYLNIVKLEIVCRDQDIDRLIAVVREVCRTGASGDGMIFVADVFQAVRVRDGATGEAAL